uniref:Scarecrow-like protein 9 n=1 Tax=Elaeis guineensis var. tenera TaxID=51953 RepID=A0A6I9S5V5_ELAGV|nr:scarecrow-like protein 9 [Elaeis guineensis]XP_010937597.1 scarecrow-like protein 9 [Elaeis guineensis]XP_029123935.1 scarecrow-like protein 9 [Elaeis guineensis]
MNRRVRELSGMMNGLTYRDFCSRQNTTNGFRLEQLQPFLYHSNHMNFPPQMVSGTNTMNPNGNPSSAHRTTPGVDSPEDCEVFSDIALNYISKMLMEEDIDEKVNNYQEESALQATEKPFYEILGQKYPPSPVQRPLYSHRSRESTNSSYGNSNSRSNSSRVSDNSWAPDFHEYRQSQSLRASLDRSSQSPLSSSNSVGNVVEAVEEPLISSSRLPDLLIESLPAWQFRRGVEEARKFLPSDDKLKIDLEANGFSSPQKLKNAGRAVDVKAEEEEETEHAVHGSRGRKNLHREDLDLEEGRSNKQSAVYSEDTIRSEMFDMVLLCQGEKSSKKISDLREAMQNEANKNSQNGHAKGSGGGKARGKKQSKREVVDLRTLLIHCAQAVAADDHRTASELLKQIRQHSSPNGDGTQRLANCFADGLEARLAGTGSQIYHTLIAKRTTATDILKAYHLYLAACPFKMVSHFFCHQTILNVAEKASRVHIIDFGIYFGFQWPCLIQRLAARAQGPPTLRITGIDVPQPGFRPTERIEETGRRLADYAKSFNVPFEYQGIASKWENIRVEDLKIDRDEVLIVSCFYRFRNLVDETVIVDSPRNKVLNTIRKMSPNVFIHGVVNGSYGAPFFVTRFREALFHYSALFDMLETNVPREDEQRLLIERDLFGREALNVIACEGSERVERPETYKQWQVRNLRAGFVQLPLNPDIMKKAKDKVKTSYHKDFVIDEDSRWLLQGWKGRIIHALSTWKPNESYSIA